MVSYLIDTEVFQKQETVAFDWCISIKIFLVASLVRNLEWQCKISMMCGHGHLRWQIKYEYRWTLRRNFGLKSPIQDHHFNVTFKYLSINMVMSDWWQVWTRYRYEYIEIPPLSFILLKSVCVVSRKCVVSLQSLVNPESGFPIITVRTSKQCLTCARQNDLFTVIRDGIVYESLNQHIYL